MALPLCSDAARARTVEIYLEEESTAGTAETLVSADYVEIIADAGLPNAYERANIENLTRTTGLDKLPAQLGQVIGQQMTLNTYVYKAASAGAVPHLSDLFKGLTGTETISGGVQVTYSASGASSALPSQTLLIKTDNFAMSVAAQVDQAVVNMTPTDDDSALLSVEWTLSIWKWYWFAAGSASGTITSGVVSFTDAGDSARFSANAIVDIAGSSYVVSSVDRTAGTITIASPPSDGAITITPWSPGAPSAPTWNEYQFLAHENEFKIKDMTGASLEEMPIRDSTFTWNNALVIKNNETGRAIGDLCVHRVNVREIMADVNAIQYSNMAEWKTAGAENRDVEVSIIATAADGSGRTFKILQGTNGEAKIRQTGNSTEDGLLTDSYSIAYYDNAGGDTAAKFVFA